MPSKLTASVIGLGYVGLPMLHLLSKRGIKAYGFDIDNSKIEMLKTGASYISDIKSEQLKVINKDNLYNMDNLEMIKTSNYLIICLPTPFTKKKPDISRIKYAFKKITPFLKKNQTIILESTVYPGATIDIFYSQLSKKFQIGKNFFLCYSPERLSPGQTNKRIFKFFLENTPKVISGYNLKSLNKVNLLYKKIFTKLCKADSLEIAEMSKLVENSYRSVNIGLVNELKVVCKKLKLDINKIIETAGTKPFGYNKFYPGPGVGGHCIPIDPLFLNWIANRNGAKSKFINLARLTNVRITNWVIDQIFKESPQLKSLKISRKILIIGLAYKADVNDTRESPSLKIFKTLKYHNNIVDYHDEKIPKIKILNKYINSVSLDKIKKYDCVIIATDHSNLKKNFIFKNAKKIFDTRGVYSKNNNKKLIKL